MRRFDHYRIEKEIGRGSHSVVYLATSDLTGLDVALKLYPADYLDDHARRFVFEERAAILNQIDNSALIPVYKFGIFDERPYIIMKPLPGGSLRDVLKHGPLTPAETSTIVTRIASVLDDVHLQNIAHGDLNPTCVLFDREGAPFLGGFLLTPYTVTGALDILRSDNPPDTRYMSPEQLSRQPASPASDRYVLAILAYEMLAGRPPFAGKTAAETAAMQINEPPPRISDINPDLAPAFEGLFHDALAKNPDDRPEKALKFADQLTYIVDPDSFEHRHTPPEITIFAPGQSSPPSTPTAPVASTPTTSESTTVEASTGSSVPATTPSRNFTLWISSAIAAAVVGVLMLAAFAYLTVQSQRAQIPLRPTAEPTRVGQLPGEPLSPSVNPLVAIERWENDSYPAPSWAAPLATPIRQLTEDSYPVSPSPTPVPTTYPSKATDAYPAPPIDAPTPISEPQLLPVRRAHNRDFLPSLRSPLGTSDQAGWWLYNNINSIRQMAVFEDLIYAATGGGVLVWKPESNQGTKITAYDGLPTNDVNGVTVCKSFSPPRIAAATELGIGWLDPNSGEFIESWTVTNAQLLEDEVRAIACLAERELIFVGYDTEGISIFDFAQERLVSLDRSSGLASAHIEQIVPHNNFVWINHGFALSVYNLDDGSIRSFTEEDGTIPEDGIKDIAIAADGTIWLAATDGLLRGTSAGDWKLYEADEDNLLPSGLGVAVAIEDGDNLWYASSFGSLCRFDPAAERCQIMLSHPVPRQTLAQAELSDLVLFEGDLIVSDPTTGVHRISPLSIAAGTDEWFSTAMPGQLREAEITALAEDANGFVWIGTYNGLYQAPLDDLTGQSWIFYDDDNSPLPSDWIKALWADADGGVYVGTYDGASYFGADGQQELLFSDQEVLSITADNQRRMWYGLDGGILIDDNGDGIFINGSDGLPEAEDFGALLQVGDRMWAAYSGGVAQIDLNTLNVVREPSPVELSYTYDFVRGPDNELYFGMGGDLLRLDGDQAATIDLNAFNIQVITFDEETGITLVGSTGSGLFVNDGRGFEHLLPPDGPPGHRITAILIDSAQTIWIGTESYGDNGGGLSRYVPPAGE